MTPEQVRNNFIQNLAENAYIKMCTIDEMRIVIDALEKQIPKYPDYEGYGYDKEGNLIVDYAKCPNCGKDDFEYSINDWGCKFCPDCGQALDWSDENG